MEEQSKKLNILLISKSLPKTFKGGIQSHVWDLSQALIERGHSVSILAAGSMKRPTYEEEVDGRRIIYLRYFRGKHAPILKVFLEELGFCVAVRFWLLKNGDQFDIIHGQGRSGAWIPTRIQNQVPCAVTFHGMIAVENAKPRRHILNRMDDFLHKRLAERLERRPLKKSKGVIYVSQATRELVADLHGEAKGKERVIYNGFNGEFAEINPEKNSPYLVFVGRLHPIKGLDLLIEAMPQVHEDIKLILVGDGPIKNKLLMQIQELNLQDSIELKGALPKKEALKIMEQGFALVLPSHFETQGIVLLEANARGIPVLASRTGGMKEVVIDKYNGLFFEPGNIEEMATKISLLYQSKTCQVQMGRNGQKRVKECFHWDTIAQETEDFYFNLQQS